MMTNKEFFAYVQDKKRQGVSESQIAQSLGMKLVDFLGKLNQTEKDLGSYIFDKPAKPQVVKEEVKPVSGFGDTEAVKAAFQRAEEKKQSKKDKMKKQEKAPEVVEIPVVEEKKEAEEEPKEEPKVEEDLSWME